MGERKYRPIQRCLNPYVPNEIWDLFKKDLRKLIKHVFPDQSYSITDYYWRNFPIDDEYIRFQPKDADNIDWLKICLVMRFLTRQFGMKVLTRPSANTSDYNYGRFSLGNIRTWTIEQLDEFLANHSYETIEKLFDNLPPEVIRTDLEQRLHQCCFIGSAPENLNVSEEDVRSWLEIQIDQAITEGYDTFISGSTKGVEIWAGQYIIEKRLENLDLHLIAAKPNDYKYTQDWNLDWRRSYHEFVRCADSNIGIGDYHQDDAIHQKYVWMVDHSSRIIAYYTDEDKEIKSAIDYAQNEGLKIIVP